MGKWNKPLYFPSNPHFSEETYQATKEWIMSSFEYYLGAENVAKTVFDVRYESLGELGGRIIVGAIVQEQLTINDTMYQPGDFILAGSIMLHRVENMKKYIHTVGGNSIHHVTNETETAMYYKTKTFNPENRTSEQENAVMRNKFLLGGALLLIGSGYYMNYSIQE